MFTKILIANRGEVACRIILSAKALGIKTVAVFSEIDADARHVALADEAFELGPPSPQQSYLNATRIIEIAIASKAEAIHPGYGFLAENAEFAADCDEAGIVFIGPAPEVIASMGNKDQAKSIMEAANIPTTPGYLGEDQNHKAFKKAADKIGYPVLLKAAAGGGGKGMRLVQNENELDDAIQSAKRESRAAFGDDTLFLEKYIEVARHVEMQVFADTHNNRVHLFDRDCSIQRRHQKIIEEAPAPNLSDKTRSAMQAAAINILEVTNYINAGTIEFLVDDQENFYFMEMNTRLQVEHPVTEMITGLDLVEWQIRVAAGEPLPLTQDKINIKGHAMEARICAEDPYENFTPSIGTLHYLVFPETDTNLRIDTGVRQDDQISLYYDSMIAKVITHADNREDAILQLKEALSETFVVGVETNTSFLKHICEEKDFIKGSISTAFINNHPKLLETNLTPSSELVALASFYYSNHLMAFGHQLAQASQDPNSPWFTRDQWRLNAAPDRNFTFWSSETTYIVQITNSRITINDKTYEASVIWQDDNQISISIDGESYCAALALIQGVLHVFYQGDHFTLYTCDPKASDASAFEAETHLGSPMPGNVVEVLVTVDQTVKKGDKLLTLEAMKMEHKVLAPADGTIKAVHCSAGDSVVEGANLIEFEKEID